MEWTSDQARALEKLNSPENVFLTGGAGTGKSTLVRHFIEKSLAEAEHLKTIEISPLQKVAMQKAEEKAVKDAAVKEAARKLAEKKNKDSKNQDAFNFDFSFAFDDQSSNSASGVGENSLMAKGLEIAEPKIQLPYSPGRVAVLASTGTAAILLGGRTFHSFFGLGIMEGGIEQTFDRATRHRGIVTRLKKTDTILIDEISMIGANEWIVAEKIARKARNVSAPWGGLRVIAVGDFAQLPPVVRSFGQSPDEQKPWAFLTETWRNTELEAVNLKQIVRSNDSNWNQILNELRWGECSEYAAEVLQSRMRSVPLEFQGTRLYARRAQAEKLNHDRLETLSGTAREFNTVYMGHAQKIDDLKKNAPIPEILILKEGALVMFRQNDPDYKFVNGTLGIVKKLPSSASGTSKIEIELFNGRLIELGTNTFSLLDAEGEPLATATNFPINLAWASTIHKAQGATLDRAHVDLKGVWEHGQSYVALSRVRSLDDLTLEGLSPRSFRVDPAVTDFYRNLKS
jgi:ATP-dependent DNA helicase PIF1